MSKIQPVARGAVLMAVFIAPIVLVGCAHTVPLLLNQPLAWTPTNTLDLGVTQSQGTPATVQFKDFDDKAANPTMVGQNLEQATARPVTTTDPVGPFVARHLQQLFNEAGYSSGGANAERVISGSVQQFFVAERNTYQGSVALAVTVRNRSGKVLWSGTVWGKNETFGRSYHIDNYQQVLSDSLIDAANNLLKNPAFREALTIGG